MNNKPIQKDIGLLSIPFDHGASMKGCRMASDAYHIGGLEERLSNLGHTVHKQNFELSTDHQNIPALQGRAKNADKVITATRDLEKQSYDILQKGQTPIFLGGDHSISMGTVSGAARAAKEQGQNLFMLWIDAHLDYNTPQTSPSGNMHGMPVAFLCGEEGFGGILPESRTTLNPQNVMMLGIRDVDAKERVIAQKSGITIYDMREIDERHIGRIIDDIIAKVKAQNGVLHVSFDADSIDPSIAPGVGTPVEGGLSYREAHLALEKIHEAGILWSCDFVELNPYIDHDCKTTQIMIGMIESLFGRRVLD